MELQEQLDATKDLIKWFSSQMVLLVLHRFLIVENFSDLITISYTSSYTSIQ